MLDIFSTTVIKTNKTIPGIKKNKMNLQIYLTNYKKKIINLITKLRVSISESIFERNFIIIYYEFCECSTHKHDSILSTQLRYSSKEVIIL